MGKNGDKKENMFFSLGQELSMACLKPLMQKVKNEDEFQIQIIASGMHMSPEFGLTYKEIERDGFTINEKK